MKNKDFDAGNLLEIALGVSCILALAYLLIYVQGTDGFPEEATRLGQLGDFFGGILNPTVSVLTLFVAIGVWRLQKNELELTRSELKETKEAMKSQDETAKQQRQEQRFFDLLNVYYQTVNVISYTRPTTKGVERGYRDYNGKAAMAAWLRNALELHDFVLNRGSVGTNNDPTDHADEIQHMDRMCVNWQDYEAREYFDSYFRVVSHLLAEAKGLLGEQHHRYVVLFRSQLSKSLLINNLFIFM